MLLDHFSMQVTDAEREAAFYAALMGWKVRSNDGKEIYMDIGDWGGVKIRGGYVRAARGGGRGGGGARAAVPRRCARGGQRRRWTAAVAVARRGGGGGGGGGGAPIRVTAAVRHADAPSESRTAGATVGRLRWGIAPWDTNKVEAALKARGLNPVADHSGNDFRSFHVKDPDGMDLRVTNGNKRIVAAMPANGKLNVAAAVRADGLEDEVSRPHLVPRHELQRDRRVLRGAARLEGTR